MPGNNIYNLIDTLTHLFFFPSPFLRVDVKIRPVLAENRST